MIRHFVAALALIAAAPIAAGTVYVRAGHLVDPERQVVETARLIRIEDGKIAAIGPDSAVPTGASVIDWSARTVLPGLIDLHTHIADGVAMPHPADLLAVSSAESALPAAARRGLHQDHRERCRARDGQRAGAGGNDLSREAVHGHLQW